MPANVQLELFDADGMSVLATRRTIAIRRRRDRSQILKARVVAGQTYLRATFTRQPRRARAGDIGYSLTLVDVDRRTWARSFIKSSNGELDDGDQAYYLVQSKVAGSLRVALRLAAELPRNSDHRIERSAKPQRGPGTEQPGAALAATVVVRRASNCSCTSPAETRPRELSAWS